MNIKRTERTQSTVSAAKANELARVRELKRNAEATIELLRKDSEQGLIHIRVNSDENFRMELAKAIVDMAHPGYGGGVYFADPVKGRVYYRDSSAAWNPCSEDDGWRIVSVNDFVDPACDFNPQVEDWREALGDELFKEVQQAWTEENDDPDLDDSIPEMITWASSHPEYGEIISDAEEEAEQEAISFALSEIKDEIIIQL